MNKTIRLEKIGTTGKPCFWQAEVKGASVTYSFGRVDGAVQSETITYKEGKNTGRANATTPEEQCLFEAEVKARKKLDKNYKLVEGEMTTAATKALTTDYEVPLPMLAYQYEKQKSKVVGKVYLQPKLDGNRCLVNRKTGQMYSRTRKEIKHLPFIGEAVKEATAKLPKDIEWIDGELFATGMTFNALQSIIRRAKNVDEKIAKKMHYHVFDVLSDKPWSERRELVQAIKGSSMIRLVEDKMVDASKLQEEHDKYVKDGGYEGAIIRLDGYGYENKRSTGLIKYKVFKDEEFEVVGFVSEKHNDDLLGAVTVKMKNGTTFEARPAMSDEDKADIWENRKNFIGSMATIKFQEKDAKSGIPRFPVLIKFRDASDVPDEKDED